MVLAPSPETGVTSESKTPAVTLFSTLPGSSYEKCSFRAEQSDPPSVKPIKPSGPPKGESIFDAIAVAAAEEFAAGRKEELPRQDTEITRLSKALAEATKDRKLSSAEATDIGKRLNALSELEGFVVGGLSMKDLGLEGDLGDGAGVDSGGSVRPLPTLNAVLYRDTKDLSGTVTGYEPAASIAFLSNSFDEGSHSFDVLLGGVPKTQPNDASPTLRSSDFIHRLEFHFYDGVTASDKAEFTFALDGLYQAPNGHRLITYDLKSGVVVTGESTKIAPYLRVPEKTTPVLETVKVSDPPSSPDVLFFKREREELKIVPSDGVSFGWTPVGQSPEDRARGKFRTDEDGELLFEVDKTQEELEDDARFRDSIENSNVEILNPPVEAAQPGNNSSPSEEKQPTTPSNKKALPLAWCVIPLAPNGHADFARAISLEPERYTRSRECLTDF